MSDDEKLSGKEAAAKITAKIKELGDWRGETLALMREWIMECDDSIQEEVKWRGTPVWSLNGGICTGETYKDVVKLTFFKGASLADPAGLFNSSLDGNVRRAIDIRQGETLDKKAFKSLIKAAIALNQSGKKASNKASKK